jgi:hypothetical protein
VSDIKSLIWNLAFGDRKGDILQVRNVSRYGIEGTGCRLDFWHAIDITDFSSMRGFVVTEPPTSLIEIDFLSRHELIPPMTEITLPPNWREWAVVRNGQILVTNKAVFCSRMFTADAFVALPVYRFGLFADDVACVMADGQAEFGAAVRQSLTSLVTGYSFTEYRLPDGYATMSFSILDARTSLCYDGANKRG